ncbi:MAG: metallophosphoesterase [Nitrososphaeraceae archaeon]
MKNKIFVIGFSLVFLIFVSNIGTNNLLLLSAIPSNSNTSDVLTYYPSQSYYQWDPVLPVSYKIKDMSLGPILEIGPESDNDNNGIIFNEPIENITTETNKSIDQLNNKLQQLKDGNLNEDNPPASEQQGEDEENDNADEKEINGNEANSDDVNVLQEENINPLERLQILKQEQENIQKGENNGADEQEPETSGLNAEVEKNAIVDEVTIDQLNQKLQDLKDRLLNDQDNQRLIEQRNEFDEDGDDDGDSKDDDSKTFDGYGINVGNGNGEENFNFAAAGDFGCSTNTQNTVANMEKQGPEFVLALGDLSYHSTADCWFDIMTPLKDKTMISFGYHDVEDGQAKTNQYLKSFGLEKQFYSYDYNNVHFLIMAAETTYNKGSEQYNFVLQDLKKASENKDVDWIIVSSYGPLYTSPSEHKAYSSLRDLYHPIFEQYGVDLVLSGHNHNYQRTYPIAFNPDDSSKPVVTNEHTASYDGQKDGIVFAIVGTGGVNFYSFDGQAPFVSKQFAADFGFLNVDIGNDNSRSTLTGTFHDNQAGKILDKFVIEKEIENNNVEARNENGEKSNNDSVFG